MKQSKLDLLKEMFDEMVVKKDASAIPAYYHPEFELYTNGKTWDYSKFLEFHKEVYATPIQYAIEFDSQTMFEQGDKAAGRIYITTSMPNEKPKQIEVVFVAQYKMDKLFRLWELTYPDWSTLPEFTSP